jgi:hypothetical protein
VQVTCHMLFESSRRGLQLYLKPHFNRRFSQKVMGFQSCESFNFETLNLGVPGQNDIWVLARWPNIENTIKGKVLVSLKSCESMFTHGFSMHQKCFNYALTNLLFSLYKSVWIIDLLVTHLHPHPGALARPFTPKMLRAKERTPTLYPFVVFTFGLVVEFIKEIEGASIFVGYEAQSTPFPWSIESNT